MFIAAADPVNVVTVAALIDPLVLSFNVFNVATASVVSIRVSAAFPKPLIPLDAKAVFIAAADPVIVVTAEASMVPVVRTCKPINEVANMPASVNMIFSFPRPVMPLDA